MKGKLKGKRHRWNAPQSWRNELPYTLEYNSLFYLRTWEILLGKCYKSEKKLWKIKEIDQEPRFCFEVVIKMSSNDNLCIVKTSSFWTRNIVIWWLFHDNLRAKVWQPELKRTRKSRLMYHRIYTYFLWAHTIFINYTVKL